MARLSDWRGILAGLAVGGYVVGYLVFAITGAVAPADFERALAWVVGPVITFYFVQIIHENGQKEVKQAVERIEHEHNRHAEAS